MPVGSRSNCARALLLLVLFAVPAAGQQPPGRPAASPNAALADFATLEGAIVVSVDDDGVPQFLRTVGTHTAAAGANVEGAARGHLGRFARAYGVSAADLGAAALVRVQRLGSGTTIAHFRQQLGDLDVYRSDVKILMRAGHSLVAISGRPRALGVSRADALAFARSPEDALAAALSNLGAIQASEPAAVKRIAFPEAGRVIAAYLVELYAALSGTDETEAFAYVIAADDGRVLERQSLMVSERARPSGLEEFNYRVWAEPADRSLWPGWGWGVR